MPRIINIQIDLAKINKEKIRVNGQYKNYDITLIETPDGKYGQWMAVEKQSKEEREAKTKGTILGNGKNHGWGESSAPSKPTGGSSVSSDDIW
jgi:hypothetical protein